MFFFSLHFILTKNFLNHFFPTLFLLSSARTTEWGELSERAKRDLLWEFMFFHHHTTWTTDVLFSSLEGKSAPSCVLGGLFQFFAHIFFFFFSFFFFINCNPRECSVVCKRVIIHVRRRRCHRWAHKYKGKKEALIVHVGEHVLKDTKHSYPHTSVNNNNYCAF